MPIEPSESGNNRPVSELTGLALAEYRELRATIRERGSLRHLTILITFSVWTATMLWAASTFSVPIFFVLPLVVLVAGFEVAFALHVAVERIGRFIRFSTKAKWAGLSRGSGRPWRSAYLGAGSTRFF
jgi:hypothetical protein